MIKPFTVCLDSHPNIDLACAKAAEQLEEAAHTYDGHDGEPLLDSYKHEARLLQVRVRPSNHSYDAQFYYDFEVREHQQR